MTFPLALKGALIAKMNDKELEKFSRENKPYKFEKHSDGALLVHEPNTFWTSEENSEIIYQLTRWNKKYNYGRCVDSNAGFYLPDGSLRSPDAAWISNNRLKTLSESDLNKFPHLCPDFVIELKSKHDSIRSLKSKMKIWITNGCRLAWLIDTKSEVVYIFSSEGESICRGFDKALCGEPVLQKFAFVLSELRPKHR